MGYFYDVRSTIYQREKLAKRVLKTRFTLKQAEPVEPASGSSAIGMRVSRSEGSFVAPTLPEVVERVKALRCGMLTPSNHSPNVPQF